ncbi:MAG: phosphoadenosine phosphosulfate reductase family protein [Desulfurococcaceae archaeon]
MRDDLVMLLVYGKFIDYATIIDLATSLSLDEKIEVSHKVIEEALRVSKFLFKKSVVSLGFSGGKSSLVTLDLILQHVPKDEVIVYFCNTLNELPYTREYVIKTTKEFFGVRKLVEILPRFTPWRLWRMFGFPRESRDRFYTPICCVLLKELPVKIIIERYQVTLDVVGIQALESRPRLRMVSNAGLVKKTKYIGTSVVLNRPIVRSTPIGIWLDEDVWEYIRRRQLPVNPAYTKYGIRRQGCMCCTNSKVWHEYIGKINAKMLMFVEQKIKEWGIQSERIKLRDALERLCMSKNPEAFYIVREHFS